MVQTLEGIKGGGGSIKVGTTGTIGTLISRELQSVKSESPKASVLEPSDAIPTKSLKPRVLADEASSSGSSGSSNHINEKNSEISRKTKHHTRKTRQIPILDSDNISLDTTPIRRKPNKKGSYIVEVVDIKCGNPDRKWATPITNRLKKLGFSKLSETTPN